MNLKIDFGAALNEAVLGARDTPGEMEGRNHADFMKSLFGNPCTLYSVLLDSCCKLTESRTVFTHS